MRTLTAREREFLGLLAFGWSNRRIAEATQLSYLTVRSHMQNLLVKLGSIRSWRRSPLPSSTGLWPWTAPRWSGSAAVLSGCGYSPHAVGCADLPSSRLLFLHAAAATVHE